MYKKILLCSFITVTHLITGCTQNRPLLKNQYMLEPFMIINETGCGYATNIADEQTGSEPETFWNGHDKELCKKYQPSVIINLLQTVKLTDVYVYCKTASEVEIFAGTVKQSSKSVKLNSGWNKIPLNSSASYLTIHLLKGSMLGEVLTDAAQQYSRTAEKPVTRNKVLIKDFIGTNAFIDVPLGLMEPFGCIREYHDWPDWNEPQKDSFYLNVSRQGFEFENFYVNLQKTGKTIIPALQKSPQWLTGETNVQAKPVAKGADTENPGSYLRHGMFMNKYATAFSPAEKGHIQYYENWNEPDKWWESGLSFFTPYQYASMSSADRDGHLQTLGKNIGIKSAGKNNKLVMAGMANPKTDYLHALKYWCDQKRKGDFAWDVINYHRYSNSAGLPDNQPKEGICPESGNVYQEASEMIRFRDRFLPGVEVWITEFGYDTENSPQQCKPVGSKSSEIVQAEWLIRSYLLLSAAGIDKAFQYMIRDFAKSGLYATSGLYSSTLKETPFIRPSWNYINTLKCALQNCYFEKITVDSVNRLYTSQYVDKDNPEIKTKIIWLGTQSGSTKKLTVKEEKSAVICFSAQKPCGENKILGSTIEITETPVIIKSGNTNNNNACYSLSPVKPTDLECKFLNGGTALALTDEQSESANNLFGLNGKIPTSSWKTDYSNKAANGIVFYLTSLKRIHSIQLFDGAGTGEVQVSVKSGENWNQAARISMNLYNKWKTVIIDSETKEIKIEKLNGSPDIGEIIIYEKVRY